jgi:3',5'-cyclic AMP phosphodiesterase CpdA
MKRNQFLFLHFFYLPLFVAWLFVSGCSAGKSNRSFYFIQMSDPQFGMYTGNKSFEKETKHFEKAIAEANRLKPRFVVITGDLVNLNGDAAQIAEYKRIAGQLNPSIPLYNVPGNHDVGNTPASADIAAYRTAFGKDYYSFIQGSVLGIVLNSLYLHSPQNVPQEAKEQEQWLTKTLEEAKTKRYKYILVFLHHPFYLKQENEADEYFNIPTATRSRYLQLFKTSGVRYIFAGHYHRNAFAQSTDLEMVTTGPVGKPLGIDSSGFRIIIVSKDKINHRYYTLDSIPKKISKNTL